MKTGNEKNRKLKDELDELLIRPQRMAVSTFRCTDCQSKVKKKKVCDNENDLNEYYCPQCEKTYSIQTILNRYKKDDHNPRGLDFPGINQPLSVINSYITLITDEKNNHSIRDIAESLSVSKNTIQAWHNYAREKILNLQPQAAKKKSYSKNKSTYLLDSEILKLFLDYMEIDCTKDLPQYWIHIMSKPLLAFPRTIQADASEKKELNDGQINTYLYMLQAYLGIPLNCYSSILFNALANKTKREKIDNARCIVCCLIDLCGGNEFIKSEEIDNCSSDNGWITGVTDDTVILLLYMLLILDFQKYSNQFSDLFVSTIVNLIYKCCYFLFDSISYYGNHKTTHEENSRYINNAFRAKRSLMKDIITKTNTVISSDEVWSNATFAKIILDKATTIDIKKIGSKGEKTNTIKEQEQAYSEYTYYAHLFSEERSTCIIDMILDEDSIFYQEIVQLNFDSWITTFDTCEYLLTSRPGYLAEKIIGLFTYEQFIILGISLIFNNYLHIERNNGHLDEECLTSIEDEDYYQYVRKIDMLLPGTYQISDIFTEESDTVLLYEALRFSSPLWKPIINNYKKDYDYASTICIYNYLFLKTEPDLAELSLEQD